MFHKLLPCTVIGAAISLGAATVVTVDPSRSEGAVNPYIFGHNIEGGNGKGYQGRTDTPAGNYASGAWRPELNAPNSELVGILREAGAKLIRYPGGSLSHNFDWETAVGPQEKRPHQKFGIPELVRFCREIGAEPLITLGDLTTPESAAELAEYLNSPADDAHPWAKQRAADGFPQPCNVKFIEIANESDHGNHQGEPRLVRTPQQYADWVDRVIRAIRKVDPTIRLGGHFSTGTGWQDPWNTALLRRNGHQLDFIALHPYATVVEQAARANAYPELILKSALAAPDQTGALLREYHANTRRLTGRDIPIALTEYNMLWIDTRSPQGMLSYGPALYCADLIRVMQQKENNIAFANQWQFVNGYFGFVHGGRWKEGRPLNPWHKLPGYWLYRLWGSHFGTEQVGVAVTGEPKVEFGGISRTQQAGDAPAVPVEFRPDAADKENYRIIPTGPDSFTLKLKDFSGEAYHNFPPFAIRPGVSYRADYEFRVKSGDDSGAAVGFGFTDARGWGKTMSASGMESELWERDWIRRSVAIAALPDAEQLSMVVRMIRGVKPVNAEIEFRNIRLTQGPQFPAYSAVTSAASLSPDRRTLYVIIFNKLQKESAPITVKVADGSARSARLWQVTGPSLAANNWKTQEVAETVSGAEIPAVSPQGFELTLPPLSMTAVEITRDPPAGK